MTRNYPYNTQISAIYRAALLLLLVMFIAACESLAAPTPTLTPSITPTLTETPIPTEPPTATPLPTDTPTETVTPSPTETATITPTPSETFTPTITPQAFSGFTFDNWEAVELPDAIRNGLESPQVLFINANDQQTIGNIATAQPSTQVETVYLAAADGAGGRTPLLDLPASTGGRVYPAPRGNSLAYFKEDGASTGLYVLNLENGFSARAIPIQTLLQRGFVNVPDWSPDGLRFAIAMETGYDLDIYLYGRDGSGQARLTQEGSQDWYPTWSPDGRLIAFLSDRTVCPSWRPTDRNACNPDVDPLPLGGTLHVINVETREVQQVSDVFVTEPPRWINSRTLAFVSGDQTDLLNPQRTIWTANISTGTVTQAVIPGDDAGVQYLSESWSPDGERVLFQRATSTDVEVVLMTRDGRVIERTTELSFPRFGMAAAWSPTGDRLAIGGVDGQCPYGIRVTEANLESVARGNPPPSMCDPQFSPNGQQIVFTGVNPRVDGRIDIYTANANGFGAVNLTVDLRGSIELIGWVGGLP